MESNLQYDLLVQGFSAFAGAFFVFLFLRLAEFSQPLGFAGLDTSD